MAPTPSFASSSPPLPGGYYWMSEATDARPTALGLGTGRFLRSVLVPLLQRPRKTTSATTTTTMSTTFDGPALIQTRGTSFVDAIQETGGTFEVDTVLPNDTVETDVFDCHGAFSLGRDKESVYQVLLPQIAVHAAAVADVAANANTATDPWIVGVGVTEAGLASHTTVVPSHHSQALAVRVDHFVRDGVTGKQDQRSVPLASGTTSS